tara:strand:- start:130 stop:894 length:765 start_codon:yes stop_codon:yes gene_type:complete
MKIFRPTADNTPTDFLNPLGEDRNEAKGEIRGEAPFVEQERRQFDLIKANESDQARFQTKKLQYSNYQIINFTLYPSSSAATQSYYNASFNEATAVGSPLTDGIMFGQNGPTAGIDNSEAKYYNIVYANLRYGVPTDGYILESPSFAEFYLMQKLAGGGNTLGGKIPRQIESVASGTTIQAISVDGTRDGVQSFGLDIYNENSYYSQTNQLVGMRSLGIALKQIQINLSANEVLSSIFLRGEIAIDLSTEGNNY